MSAQPDDMVFSWQIELFIENIRDLGYQNEIQVLLFTPADRMYNRNPSRFKALEKKYSGNNVKFYWYPDVANLLTYGIIPINYIPLLRPHILKQHFKRFPDLKEKAIFYHDSDIIFTQYLDFSPYLSDDICYLSNTGNYMNVGYFESKTKQVLTHKAQEYEQIDILDQCCRFAGITREICEKNDEVCGGAQYLLKNIDSDFWEDVERGAYRIRNYLAYELAGINLRFFKDENDGFQSWCADMWALLWNLWNRAYKTSVPEDFGFAWATDKIEKWNQVYFYHDAGVGAKNEFYLFNKRRPNYISNQLLPYHDDLSHVSAGFCSYKYVQHIRAVKEKNKY
ncbi:hypothetical protein SAMN05428988_3232 [Chitinophaga sp. YR573]|nr:hypothetical protein SAMN05428988_3232 [Chitinophaga sp. YR573]